HPRAWSPARPPCSPSPPGRTGTVRWRGVPSTGVSRTRRTTPWDASWPMLWSERCRPWQTGQAGFREISLDNGGAMDVRTVGVEEELLLVDPQTRAVSARSVEVLKANLEHLSGRDPRVASDELDHELFLHMIETRTDPTTDLDDIARQLIA